MNIIKPSVEVYWHGVGNSILKKIEYYGRTAYKSEDKITEGSAERFIRMIMSQEPIKHLSVTEHVNVTARVVCDRGVSHEIVRHRIGSYTQESTRYCNYKGGITFILPWFLYDANGEGVKYHNWFYAMMTAEKYYLDLLNNKCTPQMARSVLPNSLKTEIVITFNLREWRHFFQLRTHKSAHPDMQIVAKMLLKEFQANVPIIFEDV
jgi:thymidylate synthase (FAD)